MALTGQWNGIKFKVSTNIVRGFSSLQIKGQCETEEKKSDKESYSAWKNEKACECSMKVTLHRELGCDVRKEAMKFVAYAKRGEQDYFYVGKSKLATYQFMLVSADVDNVEISPKGTWVSATVSLTLKQATKKDGSVSTDAKDGTKKASVRRSNPTTTDTSKRDAAIAVAQADKKAKQASRSVANAAKSVAEKARAVISTAIDAAKKLTQKRSTVPTFGTKSKNAVMTR